MSRDSDNVLRVMGDSFRLHMYVPNDLHTCFKKLAFLLSQSAVCSGHGICIDQDVCECQGGYYGRQCELTRQTNLLTALAVGVSLTLIFMFVSIALLIPLVIYLVKRNKRISPLPASPPAVMENISPDDILAIIEANASEEESVDDLEENASEEPSREEYERETIVDELVYQHSPPTSLQTEQNLYQQIMRDQKTMLEHMREKVTPISTRRETEEGESASETQVSWPQFDPPPVTSEHGDAAGQENDEAEYSSASEEELVLMAARDDEKDREEVLRNERRESQCFSDMSDNVIDSSGENTPLFEGNSMTNN